MPVIGDRCENWQCITTEGQATPSPRQGAGGKARAPSRRNTHHYPGTAVTAIIAMNDHRFMQAALSLARRNLGQTWPNPSVGALVVKDGRIIAQGWTARGGRPHAETQALDASRRSTRKGATLYVTLEPCSHHGKTAPCTEAIIKAGISRCVIACRDPNPQVNGKGIEQLKKAGIEVIEHICEKEAREINRGFFSVIEKKRPYIALKIATSLDGKIDCPQKPWITGEQARAYGHLLRSRYDAIATGIGTVLADDPLLTCRLPGLEDRSPVRIVFDSTRRCLPQQKSPRHGWKTAAICLPP